MPGINAQNQYFLPSAYDDNQITLLARDPFCLYAYWEISGEKKNDFYGYFGRGFWDKSTPALKITNITRNNAFYIRIDDLTNNWYVNVSDANNVYFAEIGRIAKDEFFISFAASNQIATPRFSISDNASAHFADYRDLKPEGPGPRRGGLYEVFYPVCQGETPPAPSSPEMPAFSQPGPAWGISSIDWGAPPSSDAKEKG